MILYLLYFRDLDKIILTYLILILFIELLVISLSHISYYLMAFLYRFEIM